MSGLINTLMNRLTSMFTVLVYCAAHRWMQNRWVFMYVNWVKLRFKDTAKNNREKTMQKQFSERPICFKLFFHGLSRKLHLRTRHMFSQTGGKRTTGPAGLVTTPLCHYLVFVFLQVQKKKKESSVSRGSCFLHILDNLSSAAAPLASAGRNKAEKSGMIRELLWEL